MRVPLNHFHGEKQFSRTIAGFQLAEFLYEPEVRIPKHAHEHAHLSIMFAGGLTENYQSKHQSLDWYATFCGFNPPDDEHSNIIHSTGARSFIVEIGREWIERARENSIRLDAAVVLRGKRFRDIGLSLRREAYCADEVSGLAVEGLVLNMLAEASRGNIRGERQAPRWLLRADELLRAHFSDSLTIKAIAEQVGVHPVTLSSAFPKYYRCTIGYYVRQLRIAYACRQLLETETPLSEIAIAAGFYDQSHFTRRFKDFTGVTPARYRTKKPR